MLWRLVSRLISHHKPRRRLGSLPFHSEVFLLVWMSGSDYAQDKISAQSYVTWTQALLMWVTRMDVKVGSALRQYESGASVIQEQCLMFVVLDWTVYQLPLYAMNAIKN